MAAIQRRTLLVGLPAVAIVAGIGAYWYKPGLPDGAVNLPPDEAFARSQAGEIWIVDIRRPDEWDLTGIGAGNIPLDMRREDFTQALRAATAEAPDRPIALICARGVRSRRLSVRLAEAGFDNIIDIPEGMLGSQAGPGWLERGLPLDEYTG